MLAEVAGCVDGVSVAQELATEPEPEQPVIDLQLQLARAKAAAELAAVEQLCPGWRGCIHHRRLVGRRYVRLLTLAFVGPGPRAHMDILGLLVPCWS
jgi:hypothetical protein